MPLLYALRDELGLHGPHFGCGLAQCGACTVHFDGEALRCCVMPIVAVAGSKVVTLEGLGTPEKPHPLQQAFIDEQAAQCGYCINGMIMQAAAFLADQRRARPRTRSRQALAGNLCSAARTCGSCARSCVPPKRWPEEGDDSKLEHDHRRRRDFLRPAARSSSRFTLGAAQPPTRSDPAAPARPSPPTRSTASSRSTPRAGDAVFGQGRLGTGVRDRDHADRRRGTVGAVRSGHVDPGRHALTPDQGPRWQPVDPERRHADPARGGDRARGVARRRREQARRRQGRASSSATASSRRERRQGRRRTPSSSAARLPARRSIPKAPLKDPKDYTIVGKPVPRLDIPDKVFGTLQLRAGLQGAGMLHARVVHPAGDEGDAACRGTTSPAARSPATSARCARATSWRWSRPTNGRRSARRRAIVAQVVGLGGPARRVEALRVRAQHEGRTRTKMLQKVGDAAEALKTPAQDVAGDLRPRDEHARIDRAVVRGRRLQGRQADGLDAVAADAICCACSSRPCCR